MTKSKLNWFVILIAAAIIAIYLLIKIDIKTSFNFDYAARIYLIVLAEILFYGIFFRIYEPKFFNEHWGWKFFIYIFFPLAFTSCFYFFQNNIYLTYSTWIIWILAIVYGHYILFDSNEDKGKKPWNIFITTFLSIWITGFAFPELGSLNYLGFNFSSNLYLQIPFLRWILDLRAIISILFLGVICIKPFFSMEWKLEKLGVDNSVPAIPGVHNTVIILMRAINNGIKRANNYLNKIIFNLKILSNRYRVEFITSLKQISLRTYSVLLMTVTLISVFLLSRIVHLQSYALLSLIKSSSLFGDFDQFKFVLINTLLIYFILLLNWLLFNENIFFASISINNINKAIWYVFYEYIQILIAKVPGFLFLVSAMAYILVVIYNLIANKPFILPGIYIIICMTIFATYLIYNKIRKT